MVARRRGRPKSQLPKTDLGTRELQLKRAMMVTSESLDVCLEKRLITAIEHSAGVRLRWLYTLRFGAPSVSAYDTEALGGRSLNESRDEQWLAERAKEYDKALCLLSRHNVKSLVADVCVHNRFPLFLDVGMRRNVGLSHAQFMLAHTQKRLFCKGMEVLADMFGYTYKGKSGSSNVVGFTQFRLRSPR